MAKKKLSLKEWIDKEGASSLATKLGVNTSTIGHWRTGHSLPSDKQKRLIKRITRGRVGYEQIIDGVSK